MPSPRDNQEELRLKTEYEKAVACEMFDAYCKQILRNALADYLRKKNFLNEHEIPTADMDLYIDTGNEITERSWESVLNIEFEGQSCCLMDKLIRGSPTLDYRRTERVLELL